MILRCPLPLALALVILAASSPRAARAGGLGAEIDLRGSLDATLVGGSGAVALNWLNMGGSQFDGFRLRLFADATMAGGFQAYTQVMFDEHSSPEAAGAYVMYTPDPNRDFHAMAGKIPWLVGTYAPRTYALEKPLVGTPLMYQYHTALRVDAIPRNADQLLAARGQGQFGPPYGSNYGWRGMPVVYDACWDVGAMVTGSQRPFEYALGFVTGTPSTSNPGQDQNSGKALLGRVGLAPAPGLRFGVSAAHGPYLASRFNAQVPAGHEAVDYHQRLIMADVEVAFGHVELIAEAAHNVWESPYVGDLDLQTGYLEARWALPLPGAYVAGRAEAMVFGDLAAGDGTIHPWDYDLGRVEVGVGYRVNRNAMLKLVGQRNAFLGEGKHDLAARGGRTRHDLVAAQVAVGF